jgi:hypothetical protein
MSHKLPIKDPQKVCEALLSKDPEIIYASILSSAGEEISSAAKPSARVMIPSSEELTGHFRAISSIITSYRTTQSALSGAERMFGKFKDMVVTFGNFKVIVILDDPEQVVIALVTMKDADSKRITFQSSKIISS